MQEAPGSKVSECIRDSDRTILSVRIEKTITDRHDRTNLHHLEPLSGVLVFLEVYLF